VFAIQWQRNSYTPLVKVDNCQHIGGRYCYVSLLDCISQSLSTRVGDVNCLELQFGFFSAACYLIFDPNEGLGENESTEAVESECEGEEPSSQTCRLGTACLPA